MKKPIKKKENKVKDDNAILVESIVSQLALSIILLEDVLKSIYSLGKKQTMGTIDF